MARTRKKNPKKASLAETTEPTAGANLGGIDIVSSKSSTTSEGRVFTPSGTSDGGNPPTLDGSLDALQAGFSSLSLGDEKQRKGETEHYPIPSKPSISKKKVAALFDDYFGDRKLANWQRLCVDLGLGDKPLSSVTQCKKALEPINVNIYDFLVAIEKRNALPLDQQNQPLKVRKFDTVAQLASYSEKHNVVFSRLAAKKGGPLRALLREFLGPRGGGEYKGRRKKKKGTGEGAGGAGVAEAEGGVRI